MKSSLTQIPIAILLATMLGLGGCNSTDNQPEAARKLVENSLNGKLEVEKRFNAEGGFYGFVVRLPGGKQRIVYTTRDARYLFTGQYYNAEGKNLTEQQFETYIEPESSRQAYDAVHNTAYIQQGDNDAPHKLYVVVDPNCTYCHRLYDQLQPLIKQNTLAVRWVVVGFLKSSSKRRALTILGSQHPLEAMQRNEAGFNEKTESGGLKPEDNPGDQASRKLARNMQFMRKQQIMGTPALIYKTSGGIKQMKQGMPRKPLKTLIEQTTANW